MALHDIPLCEGVPLPGSRKSLSIHGGIDAESDLVHIVIAFAANAHDITQVHGFLHGKEEVVFADSGHSGVEKGEEIQEKHPEADRQIAVMSGESKALDKTKTSHALGERLEKLMGSIIDKVEHPIFRVITCQFRHRKTRYGGLAEDTS